MKTQILTPTEENLEKMARSLKNQTPVAFATETVYGLGGSLFCEKSIQKIFSLKKLQVAAVVFGGLLLASVVYYMGKPSTKTSSPVSFSEPPTMRDITNAELTDFAEETRTGYNYAGKKNRIDTDQLFKSVSSTELQNFLYENAANESELF